MKPNSIYFSGINSFLITQFLFFIDEGFYDFRWMTNSGNWLVFAFYFIVLTMILYIINLGLGKIKADENVILGVNLIVFPTLLLLIFYNL